MEAEYRSWTPQSLGDMLDQVAGRYADQEAIIFRDQRVTYRQLHERVNRLATGLMRLGVGRGDKVAVWMTNHPEWIYAQFAIAKIGAVIVPINTRYKLHELEYILHQSDTTTLILLDRFRDIDYAAMLHEICPELSGAAADQRVHAARLPLLRHVICHGAQRAPGMLAFADVLALGADPAHAEALRQRQAQVQPDDVTMILYTSGTTGLPKGAMLTHNNIGANGWYQGEIQHLTDRDSLIVYVPLFHCFGCVNAVLAAVPHGARLILLETFDAGEALRAIARERCTVIYGVPTMFIALLEHPEFDLYDLSSLRTGIMSGAPCPVKVMEEVMYRMGASEITITFGQTECSPVATQTRPDDPIELRVQSVGRAIPGVECKVVDPETGQTLEVGRQGEFCTRGHHVMKGYYKKPAETAAAIDPEGWLHTGDLVVVDENGYFRTTGRMRDMYICGGFNVYPREVEELLFRHPKVKQVAVLGVPDRLLGEVGMAWVELKEGEACAEDEIIGFCRDSLANFKVPRYVRFTDAWPMTATGKIQKYRLDEMAREALGLNDVGFVAHA
ncbi:MAG: AMP-binding protein [Ardenticatenaceae bacterium]|nr:AMP-binding protein [Ardenticatenaceae bacterium]